MLSSAETHLREAVAAAQADGLGREVFVNMATALYDNAAPTPEGSGSPTPDAAEAIYDELPDELIDLPSACRKYGVNPNTANGWVRRGVIARMGNCALPVMAVSTLSRKGLLLNWPAVLAMSGGGPEKHNKI